MQDFLQSLGIDKPESTIKYNYTNSRLVEEAVEQGRGRLSNNGSLVVETGAFTGRAAKDKYVVKTESTQKTIWWSDDLGVMNPETFTELKKEVCRYLSQQKELYVVDRSVGAEENYNLGVRLLTYSPNHALFANHLFRQEITPFSAATGFTILHAPDLLVDPEKYQTRSGTVITTNFDEKTILIMGTLYAGEIKKSIFSIMNYLLPSKHILPMHSGANIDKKGNASIFFGLSGTGKTTLSTDEGTELVGDDEHGLSDTGIFNFEGGCYAKTIKLTHETEPEIYEACNRFGAMLENVVMDEQTREVDFFDNSIAENGRASYPLTYVRNIRSDGKGPIPKDMFFLSADAFGVLPPVARLNRSQSMYYFLSGYTAKVAGTEVGVKEPSATFSTCFGAPFMMRKPEEYGELLGEYLDRLGIKVWLINTGWTGGPYGVGERFSLKVTRQIIRSIQAGDLDNTPCEADEIFGLGIPKEVPGVLSTVLTPKNTWVDKEAYDSTAQKLARMFHENFKQYSSMPAEILKGSPTFGRS